MRIGIIGATGFIGSALAQRLVPQGVGVVAFSRRPDVFLPWAREIRPIAAQGPAIDPRGLDALVNLSGEPIMGLWTRAKKKRIEESRVNLTERVVDSLRNCASAERPKVLINASGAGYYGDRGNEVLTESAVSGTTFLARICTGWESAACHAQALGMRVVLLRTGLVFGNGSGVWPVLRRVFNLRLGGRLGNGRQWTPWIHLEDEVGIIADALHNDAYAGPVNLTAPHAVTNAELTATISAVLKKPAIFPVPAFVLKLLLGDLGRSVLESQHTQPQVATACGYQFQHPDLPGALRSLIPA